MQKRYEEFISKDFVYLVVGASRDKTKWGYRVWRTLLLSGYRAVPVNPKYKAIDGEECFASVSAFTSEVSRRRNTTSEVDKSGIVVVTVVPPEVTKKIITESVSLGITKIWMQPGSEVGLSVNQLIGESETQVKLVAGKCIVRDGLGKDFMI